MLQGRMRLPSTSDPEQLYVLVEKIGKGAFGVVYKGIPRSSTKPIAVKVLDLEAAKDEIEDLQKEISMLALCRSPHIIDTHGSFVKGPKLWIFMELMIGSASDLMQPKGSGPYDEGSIGVMARDMLLGLEYLHNDRVIHRDIKAANILIAATGQVKLADLGVSTQLTAQRPKAAAFCGTPHWIAPEIIKKEQYDFKVDIWSFGVTLFELYKGDPPYADQPGIRAMYVTSTQGCPALPTTASKDFRDFVAQTVKMDPKDRPSATELLKHKWIRNAKRPAGVFEDRVDKFERWRVRGGDDDDDSGSEDEPDEDDALDADVDFWDLSDEPPTEEQIQAGRKAAEEAASAAAADPNAGLASVPGGADAFWADRLKMPTASQRKERKRKRGRLPTPKE